MKEAIKKTSRQGKISALATGVILIGTAVFILGCNDDDGGTGPSDVKDWVGQIESNHPTGSEHKTTITKAQVTAEAEVTLSIKGNADHDHAVTLTADEVKKLKGGTGVHMKASTSGGNPAHTHMVHFM